MVSSFYRRYSVVLLITCCVMLPILTWYGEGLPANNDIETWLPQNSQVRSDYDEFVRTFGADETILVAFPKPFPAPERILSLAKRLEGLRGISACWTKDQVAALMVANDVAPATANQRLVHLLASPSGDLQTLMLVMDRTEGVSGQLVTEQIREQIQYCNLDQAIVAGAPIVASQLDVLGSRQNGQMLFALTLLTCGVLLYANIRSMPISLALVVTNVFSIQATLSAMRLIGQEMNFILSALPVMVMVFTTGASIHLIGQYNCHSTETNALAKALKAVLWPTLFAAVTTVIGLMSLTVSDIGPIPAFGKASALGTLVSYLIGTGLTPAVLTAFRYRVPPTSNGHYLLERIGMSIVNAPVRVVAGMVIVTLVAAAGLTNLATLIDPLDFLPTDDPVLRDTLKVKNSLTSPTSIESIVDFTGTDSSFVSRLKGVRAIEKILTENKNVCHALSLADFFPDNLNEADLSVSKLVASSGSAASRSLIADGSRLWRVSLRLHDDSPAQLRLTLTELESRLQSESLNAKVSFTGLGSLLEKAQGDIFEGFWKSFTSAFVLITLVMMIALRSPVAGLVAMIPNIQPLILVFGLLGWMDYPVDIGIMMTASIALGLAVDGTFHFLHCYQVSYSENQCRHRSVRSAMLRTGMPIMTSGLISSIGLLALGLSPFKPTMRFGVLMFCLMTAASASELVLLPAFMALRTRRRRSMARTQPVTRPQAKAA